MFSSAVVLILMIVIVRLTFVVVPNQNAFVKERLGKFQKVMNAGFHFLVPFLDRVAYRQILKEQVIDVPPQDCITKDNVRVEVDGILYLRVVDPMKASYGINDYRFASIQLAQTNMRSEIGKLELDRTFSEREKINDSVIRSLDEASEPWGVKVTRYEIKNIMPPKSILHTMEQQMKAVREKRADIATSEGARTALINFSEGERAEAVNVSEGEKQKRINEAEGEASHIERVAEATADALREVAAAIQQPGGQEAVDLRIAREYIRRFGQVADSAQTSIVPIGLATLQGTFDGFSKIFETWRQGKK